MQKLTGTNNFGNFSGFSLIELMITLTIAGLLYSFAIPIYTNHLVHAARSVAETALIKTAAALEIYAIKHNGYENATFSKLQLTNSTGKYHIEIVRASKTDYLLQARPFRSQAKKDAACGILQLDSRGKKSASGKTGEDVMECW